MFNSFSTYITLYYQVHILYSFSSVSCPQHSGFPIYHSLVKPWKLTPLSFVHVTLSKIYFLWYIYLFNSNVTFILFPTLLSLLWNLALLKWCEVSESSNKKLFFNFKSPRQCLEVNNPSVNICWSEHIWSANFNAVICPFI